MFVKWLKDNGSKFPDLYFKCYSENVRGVHADKTIPPYTEIMAISLKCLITDETGMERRGFKTGEDGLGKMPGCPAPLIDVSPLPPFYASLLCTL